MDPASLIIAADVAGANAGIIGAGTAASIAGGAGAAGSVIGAAGLGLSALSSLSAGRQASESAKYNAAIQSNNAQIATQNATFAGQEGAINASAAQQKTRADVGGIKAAQAANNIDVNSGSAVDVRSSAAELGELNAINIRSNAARQAYGYSTQASSDTAQAALDREQSKYDTEAGDIKAATTLIGGYSQGSQSGLFGKYLADNSLTTS